MPGPDYLAAVWQLIVKRINPDHYFGDYASLDYIYQRYVIDGIALAALVYKDAETGWVLRPEYADPTAFRMLANRYRRVRSVKRYKVEVIAGVGMPPLFDNQRTLSYNYEVLHAAVAGAINVSRKYPTATVECLKAEHDHVGEYWRTIARYRNGEEPSEWKQ